MAVAVLVDTYLIKPLAGSRVSTLKARSRCLIFFAADLAHALRAIAAQVTAEPA
jgi:hypothetical protein